MFKSNSFSVSIKKPHIKNKIKTASNYVPFQVSLLSVALSIFFSSRSVLADVNTTIKDVNIESGVSIETMQSVNNGNFLTNFENNGSIITKNDFGVNNSGHILNFINNTDGIINSAGSSSVRNGGTIDNFINKGHIGWLEGTDPTRAVSLSNTSVITNFDNKLSGYINGPRGISNYGNIKNLTNAGSIFGTEFAIYNNGTISSLINSGLISSENVAIYLGSNGEIEEFTNIGSINSDIGIYNYGGELSKIINGGTISGKTYAIYNAGRGRSLMLRVNNSGEIIGDIEHRGNGPIIIRGGSKEKPGVLTGSNWQLGNIKAVYSDVVFEPGINSDYSYQKLNSNVSVGKDKSMHIRDGSTLLIDQAIKVDGNYLQDKGASLVFGSQGVYPEGKLQVTGGATINSGAKISLKPRDYVFVAGQRFLVLQAKTLKLGEIETDAIGWKGKVTAEIIQSDGKDTLVIRLDKLDLNNTISLGSGVLDDHVDGSGLMLVSAANSKVEINKTINVYGDYQLNNGALLKFGVAADGSNGLLNVIGNAVLKEGANVQLVAKGYTFVDGQRFVVLRANSLDFTTLNSSAEGYAGSVQANLINDQKSGNMNTLLLILMGDVVPVKPDIITPPLIEKPVQRIVATQQNSISMFKGLLSYQGFDHALTELYNAALAASTQGTVDSANNAGAKLSPAANAAAAVSAAKLIGNAMHNAIERRTTNIADSSQDGLWIQPFGGFSRQSQRDAVSGYRATYGGLHLGADTLLYDNWHLGALYTYGSTNSSLQDSNEGSVVKLDSHGVMGYGGYRNDEWLLDISAGALSHKYDSRRVIDFRGFNGSTSANFYGMAYLAAVNARYMLNVGESTLLTPMLGLRYSSLRQYGYSESKGNGAGLQVNSLNTQSLKGSVGIKLEKKLSTDYGNMSSYVQLKWLHEYHDNQKNISGRFIADDVGETLFTTKLPSQVKNASSLSLGASLARKNNLSISIDSNLDWASGYYNKAIGANLRYWF